MTDTPTLRDMAVAAGYYRIDMAALLADLRTEPGCDTLSERMLYNYLMKKTRLPLSVGAALAKRLNQPLEAIMRGSK